MAEEKGRDFVKYTFFKLDPAWGRRSALERERDKEELTAVVEELSSAMLVNSYSLTATRGDADFMLWKVSPSMEMLESLLGGIRRTTIGGYLQTPYSYFALTHPSPYVSEHTHPGQELTGAIQPLGRPYLFIYPFTKTHQWYQLSREERQRLMNEHFTIGHRFPTIKIHTTYSFGLDDQEFVLGFEGDNPSDFLELVMALRHQEQRPYTQQDTPIFTCVHKPLRECLDLLG